MNKLVNYIIPSLFIIVLAVYGYTLLSIDWRNMLPTWSDEYFYYINGLAAYQFKDVRAAFTLNLQGANVLGADPHGFAYPALHGLFAQLIGWHNFNLVLLNQLILLCGLVIIFFQKQFSNAEKSLIALIFLAFPITLQFSVTYLQESLQALFGLCIGLMFYHLQHQQNISQRQFVSFLALIFLAGVFRPLWFFWIILIFALTNRKSIVLHSIICIAYILFSFIYLKLFFEYVPNYAAYAIGLLRSYQFEAFLNSFLTHFWANIKAYLKDPFSSYQLAYLGIKYLILWYAGFIFFKAITAKEDKKTHWVIFALFFINFFLLLGLYDAAWWREIRSLSTLCYFYLSFLAKEKLSVVRFGSTIAVLCCFYLNLVHTQADIQNRYNHQVTTLLEHQKANDFSESVHKGKDIIYIAYGFLPENDSYEILSLPLKTSKNQRIIYAIPYYGAAFRKPVDYVLLRANTPLPDYEKVFENDSFALYKVEEGQQPAKIINQLISQ